MAVVINEMEVAPESGQASQPSQPSAQPSAMDNLKQVEKSLRQKQQRSLRLEAY